MTKAPATLLPRENANTNQINEPWSGDNEQWWDWYVSLACDDGEQRISPLLSVPALPQLPVPETAKIIDELREPYALSPEHIQQFRHNGYVKLPNVVSPAALLALRAELMELLTRSPGAPGEGRFLTAEMMWTHCAISRAFVLSPRLASIAAELLGVPAIRLYHDSALCKMPNCGRTPWHYDAHHFPIVSENIVSSWIPLQPTPREMGPLALAPGMDLWRAFEKLHFSKFDDSYDRTILETLRRLGTPVDQGSFKLGELSFHHGRTLHTAGANRTNLARVALSTTYFEDGAHLTENPTMISGDFEKFMPGVAPGDPIESPLNPVLWRKE